jgi:ABC-type multidrug transport system ATPase subunit
LYQHFTPREALTFAANLKLAHLPLEERTKRIEELIG